MLKDLSKYDKFLGKKEILSFINLINQKGYLDMYNNISKYFNCSTKVLSATIDLLKYTELIDETSDNKLYLKNSIYNDNLEMILIKNILKKLEVEEEQDLINLGEIKFSLIYGYYINIASIKMKYSALRNILIEFNFFKISDDNLLLIQDVYINDVKMLIKKSKNKITINQLKERLKKQDENGELAEQYVLNFEKRRLCSNKKNLIKRISEIDVNAGYDLCSFNNNESTEYDRFIEVKSFNEEVYFYWSSNEIETAKKLGDKYYLYLVDRSKIFDENYIPYIYINPINILESEDFVVRANSYYIKKVQ